MNPDFPNEPTNSTESSNSFIPDMNPETNQKNHQEFERVMQNASKKYDGYWDKNSPFLRVLLIILALIIVLGCIYFAFAWFSMK